MTATAQTRNFFIKASSPRVRVPIRVLAAILLLFVGADHYYEYSVDHYSVIPTIGTLFELNFISAGVIGLFLLTPVDRLLRRASGTALELTALAGFGVAATSLVALLVSEQTKLFGFMEQNYRPAIVVALASEAAAAVFLALLVVLVHAGKRPARPRVGRPVARESASAWTGRSR